MLGIIIPTVTFVAIGAQHSPANLGYFSIGRSTKLIPEELACIFNVVFRSKLSTSIYISILALYLV